MSKPMKHVEEIRNLSFAHDSLKIKKNDVVEYYVARQHQSSYNSLYKEVNRFLLLQVEEVDVESPPLYQNQSFSYRFREAGMYTVSCLNYPKLRQIVMVEDRESSSLIDCKGSDVGSMVSCTARNSLFMHSDNQMTDVLDASIEQEFNDISECLHLMKDGCPAFSIKNKFNELFEENQKANSATFLNDLQSPAVAQVLKPSANGTCEADDLFRVHQLNKLSPNNLFVLLTKLKQLSLIHI